MKRRKGSIVKSYKEYAEQYGLGIDIIRWVFRHIRVTRYIGTKLPCMKLGYKPLDWYLNPNQAEPYDLFTAFLEDATTTLFERKEPDHEAAWRKNRTPIARQIPLW